ncbi:transposase, partial [Kocuria oceani]
HPDPRESQPTNHFKDEPLDRSGRDRSAPGLGGGFGPAIMTKAKRLMDDIDQIVFSLSAWGLTIGAFAGHFEDVYGAKVSKDAIPKITSERSRRANRVVLPPAGPD